MRAKKVKLRHKLSPNRRDYFNENLRDSYSTHQEALVTFSIISGNLFPKSPVVELGCGYYSTPIINAIAQDQYRPYHIFYEIEDWAEKFIEEYKYPTFEKIVRWRKVELPENTGLVLIDEEQTVTERCLHLKKESFKNAKVVILHDIDSCEARAMKYAVENYKYHKVWGNDTLIVSNFINVEV